MSTQLSFILIASFGAFCQEILHWFELRNKLDNEENKKIFKSFYYWLITLLMIAVSGMGTMIPFYEPSLQNRIPFILGAAFPLIFKKLIDATQKRDLGSKMKSNPTFQDVFKNYFQ